MKNTSTSKSIALFAALAMGGGMAAVLAPTQPGVSATRTSAYKQQTQTNAVDRSTRDLQAVTGWHHRPSTRRTYPRPGYTVKRGQRMASKARNQQRNRRAHR